MTHEEIKELIFKQWDEALRRLAKLSIVVCALLFAGCATQTDLVQHGNLKIQFTQTQNQWAENVVIVSSCDKLDKGYCPADSPTQVMVVSGKLPGVVSGVGANVAMLGSAAIIRDGMIKGKPKVSNSNSNTTNEHFSTKYVGK